MANTSATGGYLSPVGVQQAQDADFSRQLHDLIVGISGLPGDLVRPRWQAKPPKQPTSDTDWCAFGIMATRSDTNATVIHNSPDPGYDTVRRHEEHDLLISFYGPNARAFATNTRDGLGVAQNREAMFLAHMGLGAIGNTMTAPAYINETWVSKVDFSFTLRRVVERIYPVLNVLGAQGVVHNETQDLPFKTPAAP